MRLSFLYSMVIVRSVQPLNRSMSLIAERIDNKYNETGPVAEYGKALQSNLLVPGSIPGR